MKNLVSLKNITKRFSKGDICVANGIDLDIKEGEIFTILGKSGSGKTTFLRMLAGLETPDNGEIRIDNTIVFDGKINLPPNERGVAVVFQNYALLPHLTIASNITFGGNFSADELSDILKKTNLNETKNKYPHEISGGQQQRVALARALIHKPKILLLDEPLSNIDTELRATLRSELKTMIKEFGITALFITHDKEDAFYLSDTIAIVNGGNVLQIGTPKDIYHYPADLYCANFLGKMTKLGENSYTRPEHIEICLDGEFEAIIKDIVFYGSFYEVILLTKAKEGVSSSEILCHTYDDTLFLGQNVKYRLVTPPIQF